MCSSDLKQSASVGAAAKRLGKKAIPSLVRQAVEADRTIKGRRRGDPWDVLELLIGRFSGARI